MENGKEHKPDIAVHERRRPGTLGWPEEVDRMLDHAFRFPRRWRQFWPAARGLGREALWTPEMDVFDREGKTVVRVDLPGMKREDIDVLIENDMLVIRGHREEAKETKEENYYRAERATGEFSRAITLPEGVTSETIEATYQDGVLEVVIPTPAPGKTQSTKVPVK
jgi:HSP20 family protein